MPDEPVMEQPALKDAECPSCGALVRNVAADAAQVKCLNCGKRFATTPAPSAEEPAAPLAAEKSQREPGSPGYWLLRIPAILLCGGGWLAFVSTLTMTVFMGGHISTDEMLGLSYLALLPFAGTLYIYLLGALAAIDAGGVHVAWRKGILKQPIPPPPGSSLPCVAPLAVAGGVLPIVVLRLTPEEIAPTLIAAGFGGLIFYLGFALDDVRCFLWRQEQLARACRAAAEKRTVRSAPSAVPWTGYLLSGSALCGGIAALLPALELLGESYDHYWRTEQMTVLLFISFTLFALTITLFVLGAAWDRAGAQWDATAGAGAPSPYALRPWLLEVCTQAQRLIVYAPFLWAAYELFWAFCVIADGHPRGWEFLSAMGAALAFALLFCALGYIYFTAVRWKNAQSHYWRSSKPESLGGHFPASGAPIVLWLIGLVLVALQTLLMFATIRGSMPWQIQMALPMYLVGAAYPTIWHAGILGEFAGLRDELGRHANALEKN